MCWLRVAGLWADKTYDFRIAAVNSNGISAWSLASPRARTKPPLRPAAVALGLRAEEALAITLTLPPHGHTHPSRSCFHHSLWSHRSTPTPSFFHWASQFFSERPLSITRCPPKRIMNVFFPFFYRLMLIDCSPSQSAGAAASRVGTDERSRRQGPPRGHVDGGARRTAACASRASSWGPPTRSAWPLATRSAAGPGRRGRQTSTSPRSASETLWTNGAKGFWVP